MVTGRIEINGGRESKLNIGHRKMLYIFQTCMLMMMNINNLVAEKSELLKHYFNIDEIGLTGAP